jgi:hypothetical protein
MCFICYFYHFYHIRYKETTDKVKMMNNIKKELSSSIWLALLKSAYAVNSAVFVE